MELANRIERIIKNHSENRIIHCCVSIILLKKYFYTGA